ncbi:MAG: pre-peptidase C-terminal domain-containing protein, partial [Verrucomicrobiota bacterium]
MNSGRTASTSPGIASYLFLLAAVLLLAGHVTTQAQGDIANGDTVSGRISAVSGDADAWTFSAAPGDTIVVRAGTTNFTPRIQLFAPGGAVLAEAANGNSIGRDDFLAAQATTAGVYTISVAARFNGQAGTYGLTLAQAPGAFIVPPGDEGGALTNGITYSANLPLGDMDVWSFTAGAGDSVMLRMGSTNFTPWIRLYGPDGALVKEAANGNSIGRDDFLTVTATNSGPYTVVVTARFGNQSGSYGLTLAQAPGAFAVSPGDEGGELTNGTLNGAVLKLGDLDLWHFAANAGDSIMLRMGSTNFTPWIRLYGPNGALVEEAANGNSIGRDDFLTVTATNSGSYLAVVSARFGNQSGAYGLTLARSPGSFEVSPGDEGGALTNGILQGAVLSLGDLDLWDFTANTGDNIMLRIGSTNFTPWIRLYGPDGTLVKEAANGNSIGRDDLINVAAPGTGHYTAVVSARFGNQAGSYGLTLAHVPEPFLVSGGDQGGALLNGFTNNATLAIGDLDIWSFFGTPGDSNVLRVTATSFTPWIRVFGPNGALLGETTSGNSITRSGFVTLQVTNAGIYTVVVSATFGGQAGAYTFKQSRVPPDLILPDTTTLAEGATLNVSISAQDPDVPAKELTFALLSAPEGMTLTRTGATNATLTWVTTEAHGPSTNVVVATVTDLVNSRPFIRTNSFTVIVDEINQAPQLTLPPDTALDELNPLHLQASVTDADLPPNPLAFSLLSAPAGMTIDSQTGGIDWTPTEAQGPSTNRVTVVVTDSNPTAVNEQQLSVTNTFSVVVREVNTPPQFIGNPANQTLDELTALVVTNRAIDADLPANLLAYALVGAPSGAQISADGVITWTPTEAQGPSTNTFVTVVSDNGFPAGTATNSFVVIVREANTAPVLPEQPDRSIDELTTLALTNSATDTDLPANTLTYTLLAGPTNAVLSSSGMVTWTPSEAQGPSTNLFLIVVSDNGSPALSATNSFQLVVREVNTVPVLETIADRSLHYGAELSVQATGSDSD